ncbi:unnamed protein product [Trichogramma brassicae]|uniref:Uncharacterized protein n=1 Tax=Trichogramma brassicae TaxID=86971 RepID=A0A6H5IJ09_9HYME|nr:unnamed protein product [Trichogramma brassicae]
MKTFGETFDKRSWSVRAATYCARPAADERDRPAAKVRRRARSAASPTSRKRASACSEPDCNHYTASSSKSFGCCSDRARFRYLYGSNWSLARKHNDARGESRLFRSRDVTAWRGCARPSDKLRRARRYYPHTRSSRAPSAFPQPSTRCPNSKSVL